MKRYARGVRRVIWITLVLNVAVALAKLAAGIRADSLSVIGDGLHSLVDASNNVAALVILALAVRPADEDHPYGHGKFETLAAFFVAGILLFTAIELARSAVARLADPAPTSVTTLTAVVMAVTLVVNLGVAVYERRRGDALGSDLLRADAAQTGGDVVVSAGVLAGLFFTRSGVVWADPLLALGVAAFIAWSGLQVFRSVLPALTDRIVFDPNDVARIVESVDGVENVHDIRSRGTRREAFVQMHLVVGPDDVEGAHAVADEVERRLEDELGVKEAFIHIEPEDDDSGPPGTRGDAGPAAGG